MGDFFFFRESEDGEGFRDFFGIYHRRFDPEVEVLGGSAMGIWLDGSGSGAPTSRGNPVTDQRSQGLVFGDHFVDGGGEFGEVDALHGSFVFFEVGGAA